MLSLSRLEAQQVRVTQVEGQALYGALDSEPKQSVAAGQTFGPGTFSVAAAGIVYLTSFDGSELRLSDGGTLHYEGDDTAPQGNTLRSNYRMRQGKLLLTIRLAPQPPHRYRVVLPSASAGLDGGQCVICMHGEDTLIFVARGEVAVRRAPAQQAAGPSPAKKGEPLFGALPESGGAPETETDGPKTLVANGKVGVVNVQGDMHVVPLSALQASSQTCLLSSFKEKGGGGSAKAGTGPDAGTIAGPVVSPTQ